MASSPMAAASRSASRQPEACARPDEILAHHGGEEVGQGSGVVGAQAVRIEHRPFARPCAESAGGVQAGLGCAAAHHTRRLGARLRLAGGRGLIPGRDRSQARGLRQTGEVGSLGRGARECSSGGHGPLNPGLAQIVGDCTAQPLAVRNPHRQRGVGLGYILMNGVIGEARQLRIVRNQQRLSFALRLP